MAAVASSAAGLLALLDDDSTDVKRYALSNLNKTVHNYWFEVSASIASVEALSEDEDFADRELASLIASKVFYHLGELDSALTYALGAGSLFDVNEQSEYAQTIVARCLDQYFELRVKQVEGKDEVTIDPRLATVVEGMLDRCCEHGQFEQAVGVALEARRLDKLEEVVSRSTAPSATLSYALRVCQQLVINREFRQQVLRLVVRLYAGVPDPDYVDICQCLMFLDDAPEVAKILHKLLQGSEDDVLLAYQVGFDLVENEMHSFLTKVQESLAPLGPAEPAAPAPAAAAAAADGPGAAAMDTDQPAAAAATAVEATATAAADTVDDATRARWQRMRDILSGRTQIALYLEFLYHHNHSDLQILKNMKGAVDARNSVCHSATILSNAYMHAGTSVDTFLRDNLEWLARATNWAKFSATAGLGVIHRGQLQQGRTLMGPYLPRGGVEGGAGSPYSEGGALYALGLIHANHGHEVTPFLLDSLRGSGHEVIQHGACLGLGLSALGGCSEELFDELKGVLYTDSAVAGEAAGISMGLIMAGSASDKATEMLAYAHDTQHEKIIRGLALGLALISYGREEGAETLIEQMSRDQDPILRYGAMYVIGLAYRGTDNNAAVQKLLHFAVTDVSDDVRRAAVTCLGFVLMNVPEQCPAIVALLAESFNPHVRYGAAMAVGLACAGGGQREAVALLEPMLSDSVDFVRQGALIAMAMVMIQQPEPKVAAFRKRLDKSIGDKHEEVMAKLGAIMAAGILDAGGRNVTIGLRARSGYFRRTSVLGLAVFTQYWYWYPLSFFLSLSFHPTAVIGLNGQLAMPKFQLTSNCKPSTFAYPPPVTVEAVKETKKVPTAVLSTTAKAKKRQRKKEADKAKSEGGAAAGPSSEAADAGASATAMETDVTADAEAATAAADGDKPKEPVKEEPNSYTLDNPARVVPAQVPHITFNKDSRWVPVKRGLPVGILVLKDLQPEQPVELVNSAAGAAAEAPAAPPAPAAAEPPPPAAFEYVPE